MAGAAVAKNLAAQAAVVLSLAHALEVPATRQWITFAHRAVRAAGATAAANFVVTLPEFVLGELDAKLKRVRVKVRGKTAL